MTTGIDVYLKARELLGTPYIDSGRKKDVGIDCIGVPIWVAKQLGLGDFNKFNFNKTNYKQIVDAIATVCDERSLQSGALLVFDKRSTFHCGIVSTYKEKFGLIHAWEITKGVCEHYLTKDWLACAVGCYGLPGVEYNS